MSDGRTEGKKGKRDETHLVDAEARGHDLVVLTRDGQAVVFLLAAPAHASPRDARELALGGGHVTLTQDLLRAVTDAFWDVVVLLLRRRDGLCAVDTKGGEGGEIGGEGGGGGGARTGRKGGRKGGKKGGKKGRREEAEIDKVGRGVCVGGGGGGEGGGGVPTQTVARGMGPVLGCGVHGNKGRKEGRKEGKIIIIIKRISRAPIYHTGWEHRALYNNTY